MRLFLLMFLGLAGTSLQAYDPMERRNDPFVVDPVAKDPEIEGSDSLLEVDNVFAEVPDVSDKLIPVERLNKILFSKSQTSIVKGKLTCPDVLSGAVSMTPDTDANLICQNCYVFCMMELVIIQYLETLKKEGKDSEEVLRKGEANLAVIRRLIPGFLDSCAASFWAFKKGGLRQQLNQWQIQMQQEATQVAPYE